MICVRAALRLFAQFWPQRGLSQRSVEGGRVIEHQPRDHGERQAAIGDELVVEFPQHVGDLLRGRCRGASGLALGGFAIQAAGRHEVFHRFLECPLARVQVDVRADARRAVVRFYNKRGTAEQWIKEGKQATHWTRLSCHRFRANEARLQLSLLAYNLGNLWRRLVLPKRIDAWSLTSLQQRLVKTGGRLIKHARYYWLLLAEGHLHRRLFGGMLRRIAALPMPSGWHSHCSYKIWSRRRKVGIVSEKSIARQQAGRFRRANNEPSAPRSLAGGCYGHKFLESRDDGE
jgi:Transposase DDE domain group 1